MITNYGKILYGQYKRMMEEEQPKKVEVSGILNRRPKENTDEELTKNPAYRAAMYRKEIEQQNPKKQGKV